MEVDFLRFVLLDPRYRLRAASRQEPAVGMQCWKGYLFYATSTRVSVVRCDEQFVTGQAGWCPLHSQQFAGVRGLVVSSSNTLHVYCKDTLYSTSCEQFVRGAGGEASIGFDKGDIKKATDALILTTDGRVFERVGFELVRQGAVDVCMDCVLDSEAVWRGAGRIAAMAERPGCRPCSLQVLDAGLFAIGFFDGAAYSLSVVSRTESVDLGNLTSAFAGDGFAGNGGAQGAPYSVQYLKGLGSVSELLVVSHPLSIGLALAGRVTASSDWRVIDLASDEFKAEMPLDADAEDTFPCFASIDWHNTFQYRIPDDRVEVLTFPPSPVVCVATTDGLVLPFQLVNTSTMEQMVSVEPLSKSFVSPTNSPDLVPGFLASSTSDLHSPVVEGGVVKGDAVKGGVLKGDAVKGDAVKGGVLKGDAVKGDAVKGGVLKGDAVKGGVVKDKEATVKSPVTKPAAVEQPKQSATMAAGNLKAPTSAPPTSAPPTSTPPTSTPPDESKDFSPKQSTIINAFVDMHRVHVRNVKSIRDAITDLQSLTLTLQSCSAVTSSVASAFSTLEQSEHSHHLLFGLMESLARLRAKVEGFRDAAKDHAEICKAISENRDQLEAGLVEARACFEQVQSFSRLGISDTSEIPDTSDGRTRRELGQAAHEHIQSCCDMLDSCLVVHRARAVAGEPKAASSGHFDLKKFLGRRRVEPRSIKISEGEIVEGTGGGMALRKGAKALDPIAGMPSFARADFPAKPAVAKVIVESPPPATEAHRVQPKSFLGAKAGEKQATDLPSSKPELESSSAEMKLPAATRESGHSPALPFSFSLGPSTPAPKGHVPSLFAFKPVEPKQPEAVAIPPLAQTTQRPDSPVESPLSTPSRSTGQLSFGQAAAFAPVLPTTFTAPGGIAPSGAASTSQPPTGFAAFSSQQSQTTFGSLSQPQQKDEPDKSTKGKLPLSFTQFRG